MKRFLKAKLTPESKSFLMEEHCDNDDCFPLDWTSSNWNLLSAEGIGKLAGYELNQLKNALLAHDKFELLCETSIRSLPLSEDTLKKLEGANYTHLHHLPFCTEDPWWDIASTEELLKLGQVTKLKKLLSLSLAAIAPVPPPRALKAREQEMTEFFEEEPEKREDPTNNLYDLVLEVHTHRKQYRQTIWVVNSTGSGKTYTCLQLCNLLPAAYLLCKNLGSAVVNEAVAVVIRSIDAAGSLQTKDIIAACFVRALEQSLLSLTASEAKNLQFQNKKYVGIENLLAHVWEELTWCTAGFEECLKAKCRALSLESKASLSCMGTLNSTAGAQSRRVCFADCMEQLEITSDGSPLVVIFDEADELVGQKYTANDDLCPLRCIQRALEDSQLIGIFLSTSCSLEWSERYDWSARSTQSTRETKTFIEVCAHDLYQDHPFFLGRPLWKKEFYHREFRNMQGLVNFAAWKLVYSRRGHSVNNDNSATNALHCALFALRFGLEPETKHCSEFVSDYMATMVKLGKDTNNEKVAVCRWLSEPILAEVSSSMTMNLCAGSKKYTMRAVTAAVRDGILSQNVMRPSIGDRGEVIVGALLGYTLDILKAAHIESMGENAYKPGDMSKNMSNDAITAEQFLTALGIAAPTGCDEYRVSFTHFMRVDVTVTEDICYQAVDRKVAFCVTAGAKTLDLVIIAHKEVSPRGTLQFLPIRVQIKHLATKLTVAKAVGLAAGMSPAAQCQPILPPGGLEIGIVIATGTRGTDQAEGASEAIITPPTTTDVVVSTGDPQQALPCTHSPYYAFLLSLGNPSHFNGLRAYKGPDKKNYDGTTVFYDLIAIIQDLVQTEVDACFTDWFDRHREGVKLRRQNNLAASTTK